MRPSRLLLFALPLSTVAVIVFALFVVGAPRAYHGVRVFGGPTEGASRLSLRLASVERFMEIEAPAGGGELTVEARFGDGRSTTARATPDDMGNASVALETGGTVRGPVTLTVTSSLGVLARGTLSLSREQWAARAREQGGYLRGQQAGALTIRAAPTRGAFAIPFADQLRIEVSRASGPVVGARINVEVEGATVVGKSAPTDARGRSAVTLAPIDHIVSVTLRAATEAGETGTFTGLVPISVGALRASVHEGQLRVESAVEREVGYFAIISETERLAGGAVAMSPNGRGGSVGLVPLPPLPQVPLWAAVSAEPELDSASTVGWPLGPAPEDDLARTRAVPDQLLLDGLTLGFGSETERRQRARWVALGFTLLAALLAAALLVREGQRSAREADRHLLAAGADPVERQEQARARWLGLVVAVLCVAMGFSVLLLVALYRMG